VLMLALPLCTSKSQDDIVEVRKSSLAFQGPLIASTSREECTKASLRTVWLKSLAPPMQGLKEVRKHSLDVLFGHGGSVISLITGW